MCPRPRIQAAMTDEYALNVTYRGDRGEPRMSFKSATRRVPLASLRAIASTACNAAAVRPTGVDIRHGADTRAASSVVSALTPVTKAMTKVGSADAVDCL